MLSNNRAYQKQQSKNIAWFLPRPKHDKYKGGMPLYCEEWLIDVAKDILNVKDIRMLNVFCGMNKYGLRVDLNPEVKPDIIGDIHEIDKILPTDFKFNFILADPPYSNIESKKLYNTPPLRYKIWTSECLKRLDNNGIFCIYHKYIMPNPAPEYLEIIKRVFIGTRIYHLPRVAIFFKKIMNKMR